MRVIGCPRRQITPDAAFAVSLYPAFKQGVLWDGEAAGYGDQPHRYIRQMQVIGDEIGRYEREEREAAERRAREARR